MSFPVVKRVGYLSILLSLTCLVAPATQEAAQQQASPVQQGTSASPTAKAPESAQSATPAAPQTAKPASPPTAAEQGNSTSSQAMPGTVLKVTTRMVLVDVVVNDGSGRPVSDLKSDDFEIRENGRLQKISGFGMRARGRTRMYEIGSSSIVT